MKEIHECKDGRGCINVTRVLPCKLVMDNRQPLVYGTENDGMGNQRRYGCSEYQEKPPEPTLTFTKNLE